MLDYYIVRVFDKETDKQYANFFKAASADDAYSISESYNWGFDRRNLVKVSSAKLNIPPHMRYVFNDIIKKRNEKISTNS